MSLPFPTVAALAFLGLIKLAAAQDFSFQIRGIFLDQTDTKVGLYLGKSGETKVPLILSEEGLPASQTATTENGSLNLYTSPAVDKVNPLSALAATQKIPAGFGRGIIIIIPTPDSKPAFHFIVIDDDPKAFPWGESKAVNLTTMDFGLEAGTQKVTLPSGKVTAIQKIKDLDEYHRAQTNFYYRSADQWVIASERQMQYVDDIRRVFLIYNYAGAAAPDVRTIVDHRPSPVLDKK